MNHALLREFQASQNRTEELREQAAHMILSEVREFCVAEGVRLHVHCIYEKSGFYDKNDKPIRSPKARSLLRALLSYRVLRGIPADVDSELILRQGHTPPGFYGRGTKGSDWILAPGEVAS